MIIIVIIIIQFLCYGKKYFVISYDQFCVPCMTFCGAASSKIGGQNQLLVYYYLTITTILITIQYKVFFACMR